jgi:hypothetical protein
MMRGTERLEILMGRVGVALLICFAGVFVSAQRGPARPLEIRVIDVEGGKAALYVTPTGQTAVIDTGFPGERDLDRLLAAIADAGVKQIDYLVSTHYHVDHIGNLVDLARRVPVGTFVDHGPTVEGPSVPQVAPGPDGLPLTKPREQIEGFQAAYADLYNKAKHLVVKPGDRLPITGVEWRIATSAGQVLKTPPLPGGGKSNPYCAGFTPMAGTTGLVDPDDAQSIGSVIILGQFRAADFERARADVSGQPSGYGRSALRQQPWRHRVRIAAVRARPAATRGADAERHPQGRRRRTDENDPELAWPRESLADALVVQRRNRAEHAGAVHRECR